MGTQWCGWLRYSFASQHLRGDRAMRRQRIEPAHDRRMQPLRRRPIGDVVGREPLERRQGAREPRIGDGVLIAEQGADLGERQAGMLGDLVQADVRPTVLLCQLESGVDDAVADRGARARGHPGGPPMTIDDHSAKATPAAKGSAE